MFFHFDLSIVFKIMLWKSLPNWSKNIKLEILSLKLSAIFYLVASMQKVISYVKLSVLRNLLYFPKLRGGVTKKNGKIWDKFPIRLDPPPSDNSDIFEFQTFLKNINPPSRNKFRHVWNWEHIDAGRPPRISI